MNLSKHEEFLIGMAIDAADRANRQLRNRNIGVGIMYFARCATCGTAFNNDDYSGRIGWSKLESVGATLARNIDYGAKETPDGIVCKGCYAKMHPEATE